MLVIFERFWCGYSPQMRSVSRDLELVFKSLWIGSMVELWPQTSFALKHQRTLTTRYRNDKI